MQGIAINEQLGHLQRCTLCISFVVSGSLLNNRHHGIKLSFDPSERFFMLPSLVVQAALFFLKVAGMISFSWIK